MSYRTGFRRKRCKLDGCGGWASRSCRVCERPVCRGHRFGSGHWFRCYQCPPEALREARALWEEQVAEERAREAVATQDGPFPATGGPFSCMEPPGVPVQIGGVVLFHRLALLRELVDELGLERARLRGGPVPLAPQCLDALRSPGRGGRRRGRPMPWKQYRQWRKRGAARRGGRVVLPPRGRQRTRMTARPPASRMLRLVRLAVVLVVLLSLITAPLAHVAQRPPGADGAPLSTATSQPTAQLDAVAVDVHGVGEAPRPGEPPRPVRNQKRAPCLAGLEVEVAGYCWLPIKARPPNCPPQSVAYAGDCLLPMAPQPRPSTSVAAGTR